jgi:hypothetical protein
MNRDIKTGLITAALMLGGSFALVKLQAVGLIHGERGELSTRWINMLIGLMEVGFASAGAKRLRRLASLRDPVQEQSLRRFTAWTLTLGGLLYALIWLIAPYDYAAYISIAALGGAVLVVVARCLTAGKRLV